MKLPHTFPFRWIDRSAGDVACLELSTNSFWGRDGAELPAPFCVEIIAQAAAFLLTEEPGREGQSRWLAGVEGLVVERLVRGGEKLEVRVTPRARRGALVKVDGEIHSAAGLVARGSVILS